MGNSESTTERGTQDPKLSLKLSFKPPEESDEVKGIAEEERCFCGLFN